ncbi:MAG: ribosome maturation factor RimP [Clostridiales bacterium]|nr:ribosome maturation factor RimP [Clostridiales bacterium]
MAKSKNVEKTVRGFAQKEVERLGLRLWDVVYEKHGGYSELILYIDHTDGTPVSIDECEAVSRAVDPLMDRYDPIEETYTFSVSSSGDERTLRTPEHFAAFMGKPAEVKLYKPENGVKVFTGVLMDYNGADVTLETPAGEKVFTASSVARVSAFIESTPIDGAKQ